MRKIYAFACFFMAVWSTAWSQNVIPVADELVLPRNSYYGGTTAASRLPFACRLKLTGLLPSTTYRYFVGISSTATLTSGAGNQAPGNMYRVNNGISQAGYGHITGFATNKAINSTELNNDEFQTAFTAGASRHGRFTTNGNGEYTGWFITATVGNATQQAIGSEAYFYVQLNDGSGTAFTQSYRTTSTIKLLDYSTQAGDANGCTPLLGTSNVPGEKMVAIYDNENATGRPIYCTFTEDNNTGGSLNESTLWNNPVLYPTVDGRSGSWAAIIPNTLTGGVKAIKFLEIPDGSEVGLSNGPGPNISANGVWNNVSTANPSGGENAPIIINSIANATLPVTLLGFNGQAAKEGIQLFWQTKDEKNNLQFEIMRAGSERNFTKIGTVAATTQPQLTNNYRFVDAAPLDGVNYYQLKQVDRDGRFTYFNTIAVRFINADNSMRLVQASQSEVLVAINSTARKSGQLVYTSLSGVVLYNQPVQLQAGENTIRVPVQKQAGGMAVISFVGQGERMNLKILR